MFSDHIHLPLSTLPESIYSISSPNLMTSGLLLLIIPLVYVELPIYSWVNSHPLWHDNILGASSPKESDFFPLRNHQLSF